MTVATDRLFEILNNICANAELTPDCRDEWRGTVDAYTVPLDDIEDARKLLAEIRQAAHHDRG